MRRIVCTAGLSALVALSVAPATHAVADVPDSSWTPDVPSIDNSGTSGGDGGTTEPETPSVDPVAPDSGSDTTGGSDGGTTYIPDSSNGVPSYEQTYPSGGSSYAASTDAFLDAEAAATEETVEDAAVAESAASPAPRFVAYDETSRALSGTAQGAATVRLLDAEGNVLVEAAVAEDGSFSLTLPEGYVLEGVSVVALDAEGAQVGEALAGTAMAEAAQAAQTASVRAVVSASTAGLAENLRLCVAAGGLAASYDEPAETAMPVVPYVLGAVSALVAVGAVGGAVAAVRHVRRRDEGEEEKEERPASAPARASMAAIIAAGEKAPDWSDEAAPASEPAATASAPAPEEGAHFAAPSSEAPVVAEAGDGLDELERLALSLVSADDDPDGPDGPGGAPVDDGSGVYGAAYASEAGASGAVAPHGPTDVARADTDAVVAARFADADPDTTVPCPAGSAPSDPAAFAALARVLATGAGTVHRVTARTSDCDLSGLELTDDDHAPVAPQRVDDPLVEEGDWCAVALRELARDAAPVGRASHAAQASSSTEGYLLAATNGRGTTLPSSRAADAGATAAYVAPVIGPSSVSVEEAQRRRAIIETATSPAAVALRRRDEEFRAQRGRTQQRSVYEAEEGVPQIARGPVAGAGYQAGTPGPCRRARSVNDLVPPVERYGVPGFDLVEDEPAPSRTGQAAPAAPGSLHDVAASAAASAYAAFAPFGSVPASAPMRPARASSAVPAVPGFDGGVVSSAVAAAYAAATYANVQAPARELPARPNVAANVPSPVADDFAYGDDPAAYATAPLSPAYIEYLVQEEFEHRHDTIAQRNAALGKLRVINGAAQSPVSVREGLALHRYMA